MANNSLLQASVLAPTMFNLYLHDIHDKKGLTLKFADDITIVTRGGILKMKKYHL